MVDLLQPWHIVVLAGVIVFIVIMRKRSREQVGKAQSHGQSPHLCAPVPELDPTLVAPHRPEIVASPLSDMTGASSEKLEQQRKASDRRALVFAVGGVIISVILLVFAMLNGHHPSRPLQVNPNYLVGTWNGRSRDVDITLTITSDPGPNSSSAITGTLSVSGFGAGSEGDCFNLNDGAIAGQRTADGIFLHGTVGESSEEFDQENGNWRETHQYSISAKLSPTGMSNGALKLASELLSCQRQPIAPSLAEGIGFDLSLVKAPTSTPPDQAPPARGQPPVAISGSSSDTLSIPVAQAIKQFPPEFTTSDDENDLTLKVEGRSIEEYRNPKIASLPSHDTIECSKNQMNCREVVTPQPMKTEDMTAIVENGGFLFTDQIKLDADAIKSLEGAVATDYTVSSWSELGSGNYQIKAEMKYNACGKRTITINSFEHTVTTSDAQSCDAHLPSEFQGFMLSGNFSIAVATQKLSSSSGEPAPATGAGAPQDEPKNSQTVSQVTKSADLPPLSSMIDKVPGIVMDNPMLRPHFEKLLGSSLSDFEARLEVSGTTERNGDWVVGMGNMPHEGGSDNAAYAINIQSGIIYAVMRVNQKVRVFGVKAVTELPTPLTDWLAQ